MTPRPPLWILYDVFGQSFIGAMSAGLILRVIGKTIAKLAPP